MRLLGRTGAVLAAGFFVGWLVLVWWSEGLAAYGFELTTFAFVALLGFAALIAGGRSRLIGAGPHCARCRFCLEGLRELGSAGSVCPECGAGLSAARAIRDGLRVRSLWVSAAGLLLLVGSIAGTGTLVNRWYEGLTPKTSPDWLLVARARWTTGPKQYEAVDEIGRRIVLELKDSARAIVPAEIPVELYATDGTVYRWLIRLPKELDWERFAAVTETRNVDSRENLDRWCREIYGKLHAMTRAAVGRRGHDPHFNSELDVTSFFDAPGLRYSTQFTGAEYRPEHARPDARPVRLDRAGGRIGVEITPHYDEWKIGQAITGIVVVRNTGSTRVHVGSFGWDELHVLRPDGASCPVTSMTTCCRIGTPGDRSNKYLQPGESLVGTFRVSVDARDGATRSYALGAGDWRLTYPEIDNVRVDVTPVTVRVVHEPGEAREAATARAGG